MKTIALGTTGMEVTRTGFGAWAIGGIGTRFSWGEQDDGESVAAIRRALERGVNWIDTAPAYGAGHSERIVRTALEALAERPYVFTKCGLLPQPDESVRESLRRDSIRRECEQSLERLGLEAIDLYQIHWPDPDEELEEGWRALAELKEEGLVRHIGVSNFDVSQLRRAQAIAPVETLQPPYSLIARGAEQEILPYCAEQGIGVIVYSPMGSGLLTGAMTRARIEQLPANDWRSGSTQFREPRLTENLALAERLRRVGERHGASTGEVAVAWTLRNPAVDAAIVGFRRPGQVDGVAGADGLRLTSDDLREIEQ